MWTEEEAEIVHPELELKTTTLTSHPPKDYRGGIEILISERKLTQDEAEILRSQDIANYEFLDNREEALDLLHYNSTVTEYLRFGQISSQMGVIKRALLTKKITEDEARGLSDKFRSAMKKMAGMFHLVVQEKLTLLEADKIIKTQPTAYAILENETIVKQEIATDYFTVEEYINFCKEPPLTLFKERFDRRREKNPNFTLARMNDFFISFDKDTLIHKNGWLDKKIRLKNTASYQRVASDIRKVAFERLITDILNLNENKNLNVDEINGKAKKLLNDALTMPIFNSHRHNYTFWKNTDAVLAIDVMINHLHAAEEKGETLGYNKIKKVR